MKATVLAIAVIGLLVGCADLKDDVPGPSAGALTVHPQGWIDTASVNFHGNFIRSSNWDMSQCKTCHGGRFDGGTVNVSCRECHTGGGGPENCATCHGGSNPAPPRDLAENTSASARGVGAHQRHLSGGTIGNGVFCLQCHQTPTSVQSPGHIDGDNRAEIIFNASLAVLPSDSGRYVPAGQYNFEQLRCENTFCHGNWKLTQTSAPPAARFAYDSTGEMVGRTFAPLWTGGNAESACGTCHGLPPEGHRDFGPSPCANCHGEVMNTAGQIIDRAKHINGRVNVFGTERNF